MFPALSPLLSLMYHSMYLTWHMLTIQNYILCFIDLLTKNRYTHNTQFVTSFLCRHTVHIEHFIRLGCPLWTPAADWLASGVNVFPWNLVTLPKCIISSQSSIISSNTQCTPGLWPLKCPNSYQINDGRSVSQTVFVKIHSVVCFIDYTRSLLKLVLSCCLCIRTGITTANVRQELLRCGTSSKRYKWLWTHRVVTVQCWRLSTACVLEEHCFFL